MEIAKVVKYGVELYIKTTFPNKDIQNFLLKHERRELFERNLSGELINSFHVVRNPQTFKKIVADMTALFCKNALEYKEKQLGNHTS